MSENTNNEKKPLLSREIQQESTGSYEDSLNSYDYETYIKPYTPVETDTYWYRWYILALFSIVAAMGNIGWNTWGPIETTAKAVFGWNTATISLLSDWGTIAFIICLFPSSYILDTYGMYVWYVWSSESCINIVCLSGYWHWFKVYNPKPRSSNMVNSQWSNCNGLC